VYLRAAQRDTLASEAGRLRSLVGVGGLRWREAIGLRVCDVDLMRAASSCTATRCACAGQIQVEREPHRGAALS
jgi:hypothetical protein